MKWIRSTVLVLTLAQAQGVMAMCSTDGNFGAGDAIVDALVYRPMGAIGTLLGGAVFLVSTPFLGIASIAPPHDALGQASDMLVMQPANWTFNRSFGDCEAMGYDTW